MSRGEAERDRFSRARREGSSIAVATVRALPAFAHRVCCAVIVVTLIAMLLPLWHGAGAASAFAASEEAPVCAHADEVADGAAGTVDSAAGGDAQGGSQASDSGETGSNDGAAGSGSSGSQEGSTDGTDSEGDGDGNEGVNPDSDQDMVTITFSLLGDVQHNADEDGICHSLSLGNLAQWIEPAKTKVSPEATLDVVVKALCAERGFAVELSDGREVQSVARFGIKLSNGDNGASSRWLCAVDGKPIEGPLDAVKPLDGSAVVLFYTDNVDREIPPAPKPDPEPEPEPDPAPDPEPAPDPDFVPEADEPATIPAQGATAQAVTASVSHASTESVARGDEQGAEAAEQERLNAEHVAAQEAAYMSTLSTLPDDTGSAAPSDQDNAGAARAWVLLGICGVAVIVLCVIARVLLAKKTRQANDDSQA